MPSPIQRLQRRFRRLVYGRVAVAWHPAFRLPFAGLEAHTGMDPKRAEFVLTWLLDNGIIADADVLEADEAPWSWMRDVHQADYLGSLDQPETIAKIVGIDASRISTGPVLETWRRAVGGTVAASRHARKHGGRAVCLFGGFHHAAPGRGAGFCGLNDVAVAISRMRQEGLRGTIAVYDLDAHPPDGLAECVIGDPKVVISSIGVASEWKTGENVRDYRVPRGAGDAVWLEELDRLIRAAPRAEFAFLLAGADPLAGDRLGGLNCTEAGLREGHRRVLDAVKDTPIVLLPAGGYTRDAWRVFAGAIAESAGDSTRLRNRYDPLFRRSRDIAKTLDPHSLGMNDSWIDTDDIAEALHLAVPAEPRFMGFATNQGVEYALSRYGILLALHRMGFEDLTIETRAAEYPHQLRVFAKIDGHKQPLVELSVSPKGIDKWRTLFVEWLSLRDPRVPFRAGRPRLPGQDAPGLGLAEEVGHVLVRMAERLGLHGVSFVPAHFHIAWIARGKFVFVDVEANARFLACKRYLKDMPLVQASQWLDGDGIPIEGGEHVKWVPMVMVSPIDPAFAAWLAAQEPRARELADAMYDRFLPLATVARG